MDGRPEEPSADDCCGSGCEPCVWDLYAEQLKAWQDGGGSMVASRREVRTDLLSKTKLKSFRLVSRTEVTGDSVLLRWSPASEHDLHGVLPYSPGQHLVLCAVDSDGSVFRPYTLVSLAEESVGCEFEVVVKLYPGGRMSSWLRALEVGSTADWRGAYGSLELSQVSQGRLVMACMGTGVAPMVAVAKALLRDPDRETLVHLAYGCRHPDDVLLRSELCRMAAYWNFKLTYYFSQCPAPPNLRSLEHCVSSHLDSDALAHLLDTNVSSTFLMLCGSPQFSTSLKELALSVNLPHNNIFVF